MIHDTPRPDPDDLLAHVRAEEERQARARLKVFLGYAAGVGKTYAMLEAAHQRRAEGIDVVVGYAETHGRVETEALLRDLEVIPRQPLDYRGTVQTEMDLDAVLARQPQLVLVDELAHTQRAGIAPYQTSPGCRRAVVGGDRCLYHGQHPTPGKP